MTIYAIPPLISASLFFMLGIFVLLKNIKSSINRIFAWACLATFIWQFAWTILFSTKDPELARLLVKIGYSGIIFIPISFYHFTMNYLQENREGKLILISYIISTAFLIFTWTSGLFINGYHVYFWGFYPKAGFFHPFYLFLLSFLAIRGLRILFVKANQLKNSPFSYNQVKYLFLSFVIYCFAASDFLVNYGIEFYPLGFIAILVSLGIVAYTIARYRLLDISVVLTRAGIFIVVYTLVLGLPFAIGAWLKGWFISIFGSGWWILPPSIMAILATAGPFIYIYIDRKTEERLLKQQRQYQNTLKQASLGMTRIRNLRKLLDLITHIVTKTVKISFAAIYLYNQETNEYVLQVSRDKGRMAILKLTSDNPLITWLMSKREPLLYYEEVKRQGEDTNDVTYRRLAENMHLLTATLVIPSFLEDRLVGLFVFGEKTSGQIYTPEDLNVFQVLASQAALAIENARFFEETKQMQEQIATAEKMATIGTMADGLSHQINNRFYALSLIAGDTIDTIKLLDTSKCTPEVKEAIDQINHAMERIQENVIQGGQVVKGLLKYTRKGDEGIEPVTLDQILDGTLGMVQFKVNLSEVDILRNYPKDTPKIKGNLVQLQEAFFNFIDNAYDAIVERKTLLKEEGFRGKITFLASPKDNMLEIAIEDNGMGIKDADYKKIFTPFFTTKASSHKGTGLGLYVINKIITDTHKGKLAFESRYGKGTTFFLELPLAKE